MSENFHIQADRLLGELHELAQISEHPAPAVTRILFSPEDLAARIFLLEKAHQAGFSSRMDAVGNIMIRMAGTDPSLTAIATGSHTDAIPNAGAYDGTVGVLGGLEAMRALKEAGYQPRRSIELIMFTAEEPTRFGLGCLGSRLMSRCLSADEASQLRDADGKSLDEWRGPHCTGALSEVALRENDYHAFIELHIEQGNLLEAKQLDVGLVEKIAAPASFRLRFHGSGGHAGAVLMPGRRDAFLAAAEVALAVEKAAIESSSPDTVGTTGVIDVWPKAINSIPCEALLEIDFRDTDVEARDIAIGQIRQAADAICARRNVTFEWHCIHQDPPAICSSWLLDELESNARMLDLSHCRMVSRAYHDALFMARICPTVMIFIPCRNGWSHRPDEYASPEAISRGTQLLAETLRKLSQ